MKHFWALPAFLRLAIASQHQFNVFDDVLAYPQVRVAQHSNYSYADIWAV
jgi:protein OS-9